MSQARFIHLRNHSEYSLLEGAIRIKEMAALCEQFRMPAMALTDTNNLFGALEFSEYLSKEGIQPIIGIQLDCAFEPAERNAKRPSATPMVFIAQNEIGYRNLLKLQSYYYLQVQGQRSPLPMDVLRKHCEGVIALTGGAGGPIAAKIAQGKDEIAQELLNDLHDIYRDQLYVEIERHRDGDEPKTKLEIATEGQLLRLAYALKIPIVATNNCCFTTREFFEAQDAMLCIGEGAYVDQREARRRLTEEHFFKSQEDMIALFADLPEAIENTIEIAKRCAFKANPHKPILPKFADNEVEELRAQARAGLEKRLEQIEHFGTREEYYERLEYELKTIEDMGFPGYFLIVADFIQWAKGNDIPVGPGRGSGAGSLVAYSLTITDLDPLRFSLLFERFLNPERVSMPDFDIDFCQDRREEVIRYVQEKYGYDKVAAIITFGALLSKAAVRDVGRVLQMPYSQTDRISKLIPVEGVKPVSIAQARKDEPRINEEAEREEVVERMLTIADKIEGLFRNASTHAAGVVIGDRPLDELVPLYQDPRSEMPVTGFNMKWAEAAGLVKFDFLGLRNLTVIKNTVNLLKKRNIELDIDQIPLNDEKTFDLYASANTVGVFQVESAGMRDALRQMKPNTIEDIVALVALYRPGPMENIPKFCKVKNGLEARDRIHPLIDPILDETQGIIVYQEQVMEIAQKMAGYSLGGADLLRRAMGKKIKEAMDAERPKFVEGAKANGVDAKLASEVFDLLEKFANYGFNKSHAAAYALVSYQTAYLKANYPIEFMAAVMNGDLQSTDKLAVFKQELDQMGIPIAPVSINRSAAKFDVEDGQVLYALGALKNVGVEAMQYLTTERDGRPFGSLFEFAERVDLRKIGKRSLEMLARAGAFDDIEPNRRKVLENAEVLSRYSSTVHDGKQSAQNSLFGEGEALPPPRLISAELQLPMEKLADEFGAIGFYLSGHPLDAYEKTLKRAMIKPLSFIAERAEREPFTARIAGTIAARQERISGRGSKFAFVRLSDATGSFEVMLFSELLEKNRHLLEIGNNVVIGLEVMQTNDNLRANAKSVMPLDSLGYDRSKPVISLRLADEDAIANIAELKNKLKAGQQGELRVVLPIEDGYNVTLSLGEDIPLNAEAQSALAQCPGVLNLEEL